MPKKIKNWKYKLDSIGVNIKNLPIFIEIKVTIIDENKTQLSVLHKFSFDTDQKFIKFFSINKKEIMEKYVKYLENTNKKFKSNI